MRFGKYPALGQPMVLSLRFGNERALFRRAISVARSVQRGTDESPRAMIHKLVMYASREMREWGRGRPKDSNFELRTARGTTPRILEERVSTLPWGRFSEQLLPRGAGKYFRSLKRRAFHEPTYRRSVR